MQKFVLIALLASLGATVLVGCGSSSGETTTPEQKKAFLGGPMPESARKEMEASKKNAAEMAAKAKAASGH